MEVFHTLGCCGNVASVTKAPFIILSRISYFGHACPKLNFVFFSRLAGERIIQHLKKTFSFSVCGHVDRLWTYQGAKIKMKILV